MNPWKIVEGKLPTQKEYSEFTNERWLHLLTFFEFFLEVKVRKGAPQGEDTFVVTREKIINAEKFLAMPDHPYHEWIYRVNLWADTVNHKTYLYRLTTFARLALSFIKKHPAVVSPEIESLLKKYPKRMAWALVQFKTTHTDQGDIVTRDKGVMDGNRPTTTPMASMQTKLFSSIVKLADVYETIANSISKKDVEKMDTKDKISALSKLSPIFSMATKKVNPSHFTQININGSTKDLEQSMLNYVKKINE